LKLAQPTMTVALRVVETAVEVQRRLAARTDETRWAWAAARIAADEATRDSQRPVFEWVFAKHGGRSSVEVQNAMRDAWDIANGACLLAAYLATWGSGLGGMSDDPEVAIRQALAPTVHAIQGSGAELARRLNSDQASAGVPR
jgi:hypothetical protein